MAKKPCARVANTTTETKMDYIKVGRPQFLKTWASIVVKDDYMSALTSFLFVTKKICFIHILKSRNSVVGTETRLKA